MWAEAEGWGWLPLPPPWLFLISQKCHPIIVYNCTVTKMHSIHLFFFFFCVLSEPFSNWNMPVPAWLKLCRPTIEPVIFLYAYGLFMHMPVIQQYVYKRVSVEKNFPYSSSTKERCQNQTLNTTLKELEKEVMWYKIIKTNFYFKNTSFDSAQVICVHLI